jgi:hypothetical protein
LDRAESLYGVSWHVVLLWSKLLGQSEFNKALPYWSTKAVWILLFTSFDLWTFYLARILFLQGCDSLFWESLSSTNIFNGLQYSFQVWQGFINVSKSFSYKDSLFILATTRKEDFRINFTFKSDCLVYLERFKGEKSDSSIFRIIIFEFLLFSS